MDFSSIAYDKDASLNFEFDHTGFTTYSVNDKKKIINLSFENLFKNNGIYFVPGEIVDQKLQHIPEGAIKVKINDDFIEKFIASAKRSVIYNLYVFGTFRWGQYLVVSTYENVIKNEKQGDKKIKGYLLIDTMVFAYTSGVLQSVYSDDIVDFAERYLTKVDNNLYKVVKNHGYKLKNEGQKPYLFGKAHIALKGRDKLLLRQDLNILFKFMNESKDVIKKSGAFVKLEMRTQDFKFLEFVKM